ncbi:MAG: alpha-amylase [Promethearchaeota archaeon]|nr:MAG: alpha-amylase [Candidatus Lokiarchaeota archaeon]
MNLNQINPPTIYNIFPRLAGPIPNWKSQIPHAKSMGFSWIYLNPFNKFGISGSLYAIHDYFQIDPLFAADAEDCTSWGSFRQFVTEARANGLRVMMDLVVNHTAIDAVESHPQWYTHKWMLFDIDTGHPVQVYESVLKAEIKVDETRFPSEKFELRYDVARPYATNPGNTNEVQIWGDLAEIQFDSPYLTEIMAFLKKYVHFCLDLGVDGFRCDAAYQVVGEIWKELIDYAKHINPGVIFWAETLGAGYEQHLNLEGCGFDYFANSSKWWDYTAPWCVEQHNLYREYAPSIGFPESHDTPRLALESENRQEVQVFKYFFAAFFSEGVLMPMGYEFGARNKLHVVETSPSDQEPINFNISQVIAKINILKQNHPVMREEGLLVQYPYPDSNILVLKKETQDGSNQMLLIYNKDWGKVHEVSIEDITGFLHYGTQIFDISDLESEKTTKPYSDKKIYKNLIPNEFLLFSQSKESPSLL